MKTIAISLCLATLALSACGLGNQRNYSNEVIHSLRASYLKDQKRYTELHQTGKLSIECLDAINNQLDMALKSLDHDAQGDAQQRDRALSLADEAGLEQERLGCP